MYACMPVCVRVEEFAANVQWALNNDPLPLTEQQRYTLTWEAATERSDVLNLTLTALCESVSPYVCVYVCMYVPRFLDASRMTRAMKDDSDKFFLRNRYAVWLWQTVT
jgi:hypothetical protein